MISGTTDSGQGSGTSCGSTSDDEVVILGDHIQVDRWIDRYMDR